MDITSTPPRRLVLGSANFTDHEVIAECLEEFGDGFFSTVADQTGPFSEALAKATYKLKSNVIFHPSVDAYVKSGGDERSAIVFGLSDLSTEDNAHASAMLHFLANGGMVFDPLIYVAAQGKVSEMTGLPYGFFTLRSVEHNPSIQRAVDNAKRLCGMEVPEREESVLEKAAREQQESR